MQPQVEAIIQTASGEWLAFDDPARLVVADSPDGVRAALADVERLTRDLGLHAVGFVTYEAGGAFGLPRGRVDETAPLVWFGLFEPPHVRRIGRPADEGDYQVGPLTPSISQPDFRAAFDHIKGHLAAGDTYQVNFTFKMRGAFEGNARALFSDLIGAQRGEHSAFIRVGDFVICSASPESFFNLDGVEIRCRPMKGTSRRGRTLAEDRLQRDGLRESGKQQAENVMIVDLVRNDLGRIAEVGSIAVPELFTVERYPNVWQMTSSVTARSLASLEEIFAAMHPSASVTGAPKVRTMEILSQLEQGSRGVYTGAIGHVPPDGNASFNVAIRTAVINQRAKTIEFGIGSGIVWESNAAAEYEECLLKGSVLGQRTPEFELLETLRWTPDEGYFLLGRHLERLRDSAEYFGLPFSEDQAVAVLGGAAVGATEPLRVRLLLAHGAVRAEHQVLSTAQAPVGVTIARHPIDPDDVWLYHKTTNRRVYDEARSQAEGFDDVILWNPHRQVTEATMANVVVELDGVRVTPPVECGLLAGTYRADLLAQGAIQERVVTLDDLRGASRIWLINSVYGLREAVLG